ncbi:6397_t:CDS:1, partial [Dentiscutata heterogama]
TDVSNDELYNGRFHNITSSESSYHEKVQGNIMFSGWNNTINEMDAL